jgi:hypothetical protein
MEEKRKQIMYFYWCVKCKTKDCPAMLIVKYIGPDDGVPPASISLSGALHVNCSTCGQIHTYHAKDLEVCKRPEPPSQFHDLF